MTTRRVPSNRKLGRDMTRGHVSWSDDLEEVYFVGKARVPVITKRKTLEASKKMSSSLSIRTASPALSICSDVSEISIDVTNPDKEQPIRLSIDDFKLALDLERTRSKLVSRCEAIKSAQSRIMTVYAKARQDRHGPSESMSLPSYSRPQTRAENDETGLHRARSAVTLPPPHTSNIDDSDTVSLVKKRPPTSKICLRVQSALGNVPPTQVDSVCRQCCEVLGPSACHQCAKIQRRQKDMYKFQKAYPSFLDPEDDVITGIMMKKYFPLMETDHIQNMVAQGQISSPKFKETLGRLKEESTRKSVEAETRRMSVQKAAVRGKGTYTFFSSIRDLNQKIVTGRVSKKMTTGRPDSNPTIPKGDQGPPSRADKKMTFTELICPMFISPKRLKSEPPAFIAKYSPPLLAKESQNVEPSFFAGSDMPYKLPERLPDKLLDSEETQ